jgi:hypothetical protein
MGHRDASGWHVDKQAPILGGAKSDQYYNMLLAVNGVNATLLVDNKLVFTHTYQPRIVGGVALALNWGMVGVGADNSRGAFDNVRVQILPPQITLDTLEDFNDGAAQLFTGDVSGAWSVSAGRYSGTPVNDIGFSLLDLGPEHLKVSSYLELNGTVNATVMAGYIFDRYGDTSFKFAAIDAPNDRLVIGHYTKKGGFKIDASFATTIDAGKDYTLNVTLKGTTVNAKLSLTPNSPAHAQVGFAFNAGTVDGNFGLLAKGGQATFDDLRVKTNDPAFAPSVTGSNMLASEPVLMTDSASTLTQAELDAAAGLAMSTWTEALGDGDARLAGFGSVQLRVADLGGRALGYTEGSSVWIDGNAAGYGWSTGDAVQSGRMDLVTVVTHELGNLIGFRDNDPLYAVMDEDLEPGLRYDVTATAPAQPAEPATREAPRLPSFDFGVALGTGWNGVVDWQGSAGGSWDLQLSPYAPAKPAKAPLPTLAAFDVKPGKAEGQAGFDKLGRALLGKGKTER